MSRILAIDDDIEIREMLKQLLERAGYEVLVAPDGKEALKLHQAKPVNLIITDIVMPEKEGLETIMEFQRQSPGVKIIAISGGGKIEANEYLNLAKMLGAKKTFSKPFELKKLLTEVRELLQQP
jgi:DNA-binding response OmpR family regulator